MNGKRYKLIAASLQIAFLLPILFVSLSCDQKSFPAENERFASFIIDPHFSNVEMFWKDGAGEPFKNFQNLENYLAQKNRRLVFAMNGGIYERGNSPKGLFIQNHKILVPLDKQTGAGNFYLKPNGVFYLTTNNEAFVTPTEKFVISENIKFATQSGPMLVVDGNINPQFTENSSNLNVRNGVGILPDNKVVFAMSRQAVSFYEFAEYFKSLNCREALYLDGFVSRMYLPGETTEQLDGDFAVIIGVTAKSNE